MSAIANWQEFRVKYGDHIVEIFPSEDSTCKLFKYQNESERPGDSFKQPVQTANEHGVTFNNDGSGFTLNAAIDSVIKMASLGGSEIAVRARIPYATAAQSQNAGSSAGNRAFFGAVELKMRYMAASGDFYREVMTDYGCGTAAAAACDIGVVNASVSGANLAAPQVVNLTRASWNAAIWQFMAPNALVDIYQADGTTLRAAAVTVQATEETTNRLTLFKSGSAVTVAATDKIILPGALTKQCYGVQAILENTGTLFGIDSAANPVWKPTVFNAAGQLTTSKVRGVGIKLARKGLKKGADMAVPAEAFGDLADECQNDQRINDDRESRIMGPNKIKVRTPCGDIEVTKNLYMKQGIAFVIGKDAGPKRVGAQELGFDVANSKKFLETPVADAAAYEFRMYGQNAPFLEGMAHCAIVNGITSTYDSLPA
jgi:hypothetical protein